MRFHKMTMRLLILGIVLSSMLACNEADGPELLTKPHFPQQREGVDIMEALFVGKLVLENGCLRAKTTDGRDYLLIWPHGFELTVDDQDIRISDGSGVSLSIGEEIPIGGGEASPVRLQAWVEHPLPDDCHGPYWLVGEILAN